MSKEPEVATEEKTYNLLDLVYLFKRTGNKYEAERLKIEEIRTSIDEVKYVCVAPNNSSVYIKTAVELHTKEEMIDKFKKEL